MNLPSNFLRNYTYIHSNCIHSQRLHNFVSQDRIFELKSTVRWSEQLFYPFRATTEHLRRLNYVNVLNLEQSIRVYITPFRRCSSIGNLTCADNFVTLQILCCFLTVVYFKLLVNNSTVESVDLMRVSLTEYCISEILREISDVSLCLQAS